MVKIGAGRSRSVDGISAREEPIKTSGRTADSRLIHLQCVDMAKFLTSLFGCQQYAVTDAFVLQIGQCCNEVQRVV